MIDDHDADTRPSALVDLGQDWRALWPHPLDGDYYRWLQSGPVVQMDRERRAALAVWAFCSLCLAIGLWFLGQVLALIFSGGGQ